MKHRENTFRIDYATVPKKPSEEVIHDFVANTLLMTREEVKRIQCSKYHGCAFVKASDLTVAQRVVAEHDEKHEIESDGKTYKLRIKMEDGAVEVKLYDLPEEVLDDQIVDFLSDYGEVLTIRELQWNGKFNLPDAATGIRVAKMVVHTNIPSFVTIDGEHTALSYHGQLQTCKHCREYVHIGIPCVTNKKLMIQKLSADQNKASYASVTRQKPKAKPASKPKPMAPKTINMRLTANKTLAPQTLAQAVTNTAAGSKSSSPVKEMTVQNKEPVQNRFKIPDQISPMNLPADAPRKSAPGGKNDGSETDDSSTSSSSRRLRARLPNKKPKQDASDCDEPMVDSQRL